MGVSSLRELQKGLTLYQKLEKLESEIWYPSSHLFGSGVNKDDFEISHYVYFLNNVACLESLEEGLRQLSPLADDALAVAEQMDEEDFSEFKRALSHERHIAQEGGESRMPIKYSPLLIPERFLVATPVAEKFAVGLGATCMRIMYSQRHGS